MTTHTPVKHIGLSHGVALYLSAILGAGVLVLPGQVASMAGPASLISWTVACLISVPLAAMFAGLAKRYPEAGGIATYASAAFGPMIGGVTGWLFFAAGSIGQTIVPLTGGYYLSEALGLGSTTSFVVAALILGAATVTNLLGLRASARAQLALAGSVGAALVVTILVSVPRMDLARLEPFAPHGVAPIGSAVIVLFFAFAGWEAISHLAGEFKDPDRDLGRAVTATALIITVLYLGTACAVVLTGTYGAPDVDRIAIGLLLSEALGPLATPVAAAVAVVISLGTTSAFIAGTARLAGSLAATGWLPAQVAASRQGVPRGGVFAVAGVAYAGLLVAAVNGWGTETLVVVPATLVVGVYVIAAAAAIRLLRGWGRLAGITALSMTALTVPSALENALITVVVVVLALACRWVNRPRTASQPTASEPSQEAGLKVATTTAETPSPD